MFINLTLDNRNTTLAFDRKGNIAGKYPKQHLTLSETALRKLDSDYSFEFSEPYIAEIDGLRFGFLTCYDFYFYENFANIARHRVDIIIGCSHQRSDRQDALETMTKFCAYNTNAYVLRASVSMGEDSDIGGGSMAAAPDGKLLLNMKSRVGMECVEIDPLKKYYKPAGFNNPDSAHWEYTEKGDRPWEIVERALENGCGKVQFFKPYFNREMIDKAHANGLRCNVFYADDEKEAREFLEMGIDTVLTNDYHKISQIIKDE